MAESDVARVFKGLHGSPGFNPEPWYNAPGDCLEWYFRNDESYARRLDDKLTVYLALESDELVGCQIKGVQALLSKWGSFGIDLRTDRVRLSVLFLVSHYDAAPPNDDVQHWKELYDDLLDRAGEREVDLVGVAG